jgi:DNA-binding NarL/FixJ family response regulator
LGESVVKELDSDDLTSPLGLTPAEHRVFLLAGKGLKNREISLELGTSEQNVKNHLKQIFLKLGISERSELVGFSGRRRPYFVDCPHCQGLGEVLKRPS